MVNNLHGEPVLEGGETGQPLISPLAYSTRDWAEQDEHGLHAITLWWLGSADTSPGGFLGVRFERYHAVKVGASPEASPRQS